MTFEVDNEALKTAMLKHYEQKLARDLREMFIFSENPDMAQIWQLYGEEVRRKQQEEPHPIHKWVVFALVGGILGSAIVSLWRLFTTT